MKYQNVIINSPFTCPDSTVGKVSNSRARDSGSISGPDILNATVLLSCVRQISPRTCYCAYIACMMHNKKNWDLTICQSLHYSSLANCMLGINSCTHMSTFLFQLTVRHIATNYVGKFAPDDCSIISKSMKYMSKGNSKIFMLKEMEGEKNSQLELRGFKMYSVTKTYF